MAKPERGLYDIFIDFVNWDRSKVEVLDQIQRKVNSFEYLAGVRWVLFDSEIESRRVEILELLDKTFEIISDKLGKESPQGKAKKVEVLALASKHKRSIETSIDEVFKKRKSYLTISIEEIISDYQGVGKRIKTYLGFIPAKENSLDRQEIFDRIFYFYRDLIVYGFYQSFADSFHKLLHYLIDNDYKMPLLPGLTKPIIINTDRKTNHATWALSKILEYPESVKIIQWDEEKLEKVVLSKYVATPFSLYSAVSHSFTEFLLNEDKRRLRRCTECQQFFVSNHIKRNICYPPKDCDKVRKRKYQRRYMKEKRDPDSHKFDPDYIC